MKRWYTLRNKVSGKYFDGHAYTTENKHDAYKMKGNRDLLQSMMDLLWPHLEVCPTSRPTDQANVKTR